MNTLLFKKQKKIVLVYNGVLKAYVWEGLFSAVFGMLWGDMVRILYCFACCSGCKMELCEHFEQ